MAGHRVNRLKQWFAGFGESDCGQTGKVACNHSYIVFPTDVVWPDISPVFGLTFRPVGRPV